MIARAVRLGFLFVAVVSVPLVGAQFVGAGGAPDDQGQESRGGAIPLPDYELEKRVPPGLDVFDLTLSQTRAFSARKNFKLLGHSYLRGPWLTASARERGLGGGFNTVRVHEGIAYVAGYWSPPTVFGVVIADVRNPRQIKPLGFIPCTAGTTCNYLALNEERDILVTSNDISAANPKGPPAGEPVRSGFGFWDVSNPRAPKKLGYYANRPNGRTHGFDIDDRYVYACANDPESKTTGLPPGNQASQEVKVLDYSDPTDPRETGNVHIQGQRIGEDFAPDDRLNPRGDQQRVDCHELMVHGDHVYVAWRDAGAVIVDVSDRSNPRIVSRWDYVPPFNGGVLGALHSILPVPTGTGMPNLAVLTDEIFDCPPGVGRILDISDLDHPQLLSSLRIPAISDKYDRGSGTFVCEEGLQSTHLPWLDHRSAGLLYVTWYDQGVRAFDISNPHLPREVGYYLSPKYETDLSVYPTTPPFPFFLGRFRASREVYQDDETGRIYMTDGNGGGLTVLEWTGRLPKPPIPGAR